MLSHLEPSSAITGGPWYTDNELDTEFIKQLMDACLGFIRKMVSFFLLLCHHCPLIQILMSLI